MKKIRESILKCLKMYSYNDDKLISELDKIAKEEGRSVFTVIISILTHLNIEPDVAKNHWHQIVAHRNNLNNSLGRNVNLRTAICDYFCSINKSFKNPMVVEIHIFEDIVKTSKYDYLTGLYGRSSLDELISRELARAKRYDTELSVLFFDLDDFKVINDTFGHLAGDVALKHVARIIIKELRTEDIAVRYGGEEIVVLLPETGTVDALVLGERIREKVEDAKLEYEGQIINMTMSGGLASFPIDADNETNLIKYADNAVYRAKASGKNNIVVYSKKERRYMRIGFDNDIRIEKTGSSDTQDVPRTNSKNISMGGVLFESDRLIDIGTKVKLWISVDTTDETLLVLGTVVRVEALSSDKYDTGVSFIELTETAKKEVSRIINRASLSGIE